MGHPDGDVIRRRDDAFSRRGMGTPRSVELHVADEVLA
jgi:hypothetical protein